MWTDSKNPKADLWLGIECTRHDHDGLSDRVSLALHRAAAYLSAFGIDLSGSRTAGYKPERLHDHKGNLELHFGGVPHWRALVAFARAWQDLHEPIIEVYVSQLQAARAPPTPHAVESRERIKEAVMAAIDKANAELRDAGRGGVDLGLNT